MTHPPTSATRQIARAAGTVMLAFVFSQVAGLVRSIVVASAFGTGPEMEAFNVANQIPSTLFRLIAGGALGSAFIPTFTRLLVLDERRSAWKLASAVLNWVLLVLTLAAALAWIFAPQIVRYAIAPGFASDPAKEALTISLMRLMLPSAVIFGISGLVMGILNSHQVFLVPALTPSMYQLGMIFGVLVLSPSFGIYGLAWGVVLGAALHLALQLPSLLRQGALYLPTFGHDLPAVSETARLMGPRLLGVAVVELNFWVNKRLASGQAGAVTALEFAFALMLMPQGAIAQSVATAILPTLAAQYARGQLDEVRTSLAASLRGVLLLSVPASIGLILLRRPLVAGLYQRGDFTRESTELVAWALLWYAAGLVGHSVVEILSRAFYALHDTRTPVAVGVAAMSLNVAFSYGFVYLFSGWGLPPHGGLALANSLATGLEAAGLLALMGRRLSGLQGRSLGTALIQSTGASLIMAAGLWVWLELAASLPAWLAALGGLVIGPAIYGACVLLLGIPEARILLRFALGRFIRSSNR